MLDAGKRGSFVTALDQLRHLVVVARDENFDAPVADVAHPACQAGALRGAHYPVTIADALNAAGNQNALCYHIPELDPDPNGAPRHQSSTAHPKRSASKRRRTVTRPVSLLISIALNEETIDGLIQNAGAVFPPETSLDETMPSLTSGYALIVVEHSKPVGILTKIDVLDYVAGKI